MHRSYAARFLAVNPLHAFLRYLWQHRLIPSTLSLDLRDPGVGAKRLDAAGLGGEAPPSLAGGIDDSLVIVMQPVREEALLEVEPHPLDRIELRRIGRQGHERDVGRHAERARVMPAGLIKHHDDVLIVGDGGSEAVEELLHRLDVGIGHDEGKAVVGAGLNASKDVGECEALIAEPRRALAALPPDMTGPTLLADPRLVLKEQADALVFMCSCNSSQQRRGSF